MKNCVLSAIFVVCVTCTDARAAQEPTNGPVDTCYMELRDRYATSHPEDETAVYGDDYTNLTETCTEELDEYWGTGEPEECANCAQARKRRGTSVPDWTWTVDPANASLWAQACRIYDNASKCIGERKPNCSLDFSTRFIREVRYYFDGGLKWIPYPPGLYAFAERVCDGPKVKEEIAKLIDEGAKTDCIFEDNWKSDEFGFCANFILEDFSSHGDYFVSPEYYEQISAAMLRCYRDALINSTCSATDQTLAFIAGSLMIPPTVDETKLGLDLAPTLDLSARRRCTVGVYGDPHLRLCERSSLITCGAAGSQVYFKNPFITIAGYNTRVWAGTDATAITSLEIVFSTLDGSNITGYYVASDSQLPAVFTNDNATIGTGANAVQVYNVWSDTNVRIFYPSLGLVLKIRRWNSYYFFTLRVAQKLVVESVGLLVTGCPKDYVLNAPSRRRRGLSMESCQEECSSLNDTEVLEDGTTLEGLHTACVFDCYQDMSLAITNMTMSAVEEEQEVIRRDEEAVEEAKVFTYPRVGVQQNSGTFSKPAFFLIAICFVALYFLA